MAPLYIKPTWSDSVDGHWVLQTNVKVVYWQIYVTIAADLT